MSEPLMIRLLSASVAVANRSGRIIREVLRSGQLGVVQKVSFLGDDLWRPSACRIA